MAHQIDEIVGGEKKKNKNYLGGWRQRKEKEKKVNSVWWESEFDGNPSLRKLNGGGIMEFGFQPNCLS